MTCTTETCHLSEVYTVLEILVNEFLAHTGLLEELMGITADVALVNKIMVRLPCPS